MGLQSDYTALLNCYCNGYMGCHFTNISTWHVLTALGDLKEKVLELFIGY